MREIKFRGYSKILKKYVYGNLLEDDYPKEGSIYQIVNKTTDSRFDVEEASIGQYTGFEDRSGKEIYEGDIVEYETSDEMDTYINQAEVYFDNELGVWMAHERRVEEVDSDIRLYSMNGKVEVIGNVYEEQLKEGK